MPKGNSEGRDTVIDFISGAEVPATPEEVEAVQVFARRLVEDYLYPTSNIQTHPQFGVRRSPSDEVRSVPLDIAVFRTAERTEDNLFMVVECKRKNRKEGFQQLKRYLEMCPAEIGVWFNGSEHTYLWKVAVKGRTQFVELPNIPRYGQRIQDIGRFRRKDLRAPQNLKAVFKDIRNHLAGLTTGITRDEALAKEIMNLLLCKIYDEINTGPEETVTFRAGVGEDPEQVRSRLVQLFEDRVKGDFADVFTAVDEVSLDTSSLVYVVGELQNYCITDAERDSLGEAFEVFIGPSLKGSEGQFFTPRNVVRLAVEILDPQPGKIVIDPACGSGGFLVVALEHMWRVVKGEGKRRELGADWIRNEQRKVASRCIRGIDKDSFLAKVTKAYMAIVRDGRGGIFCENSLVPPAEWQHKTQAKIALGTFDILLTNPPFGAKIPIRGEGILNQYPNLGYRWKRDRGTRKWSVTNKLQGKVPPQILFIERCMELLRPGGRMAIVLPDGILGGEKLGYIAHYIQATARVIALIDLPIETFAPMVTTKTHLVVLEKAVGSEEAEYEIFMAVARNVGHDRKGRPLYNSDGRISDDLPTIAENYRKLMVEGQHRDEGHLGYKVQSGWLENSLIAKRYLPEFMAALRHIQSLPFPKKTIREIRSSLNTGANVPNTAYTTPQHGVPYILVKNITDEGINWMEMKHVTRESVAGAANAVVSAHDIVINRTGNAGIAAVVPEDLADAVACGFVFRLVLKDSYDPFYVSAFLNSELGRKQTLRLALGSVLEHITKSELDHVTIVFAPPEQREELARSVRRATDMRVEARNLMNTAEAELDRLFR